MKSVVLYISTMGGGGAERVMSILFEQSPSDVTTTLILSKNLVKYPLSKQPIILLNGDNQYGVKLFKVFSSVVAFLRYCRYIHREKPDISVSFLNIPNISNMLACIFGKTKCITSLRNSPSLYTTLFEKITLKIYLLLAHYLSNIIIVNSRDIQNVLVRDYGFDEKKVRFINNPKNILDIQKRKCEGISVSLNNPSEFMILATGRLFYQKGYVHLLRVFSYLRQKYMCNLVICGDGPLRPRLEGLSKNLAIDESVIFLGFQSNVYKYMNVADVFVMSSLYEGQPNALIEALICGCPCVSVDCDYGPREILENGRYGLLSKKITKSVQDPVHDPLTDEEQDLYDKLELMITNKELREEFKRKSVEVYDKFDEKIIVKKYFDTFLEGVQDE